MGNIDFNANINDIHLFFMLIWHYSEPFIQEKDILDTKEAKDCRAIESNVGWDLESPQKQITHPYLNTFYFIFDQDSISEKY